MRASFNVLDEPWIPVLALDGTRTLLGIRETLRRASELQEISAVSGISKKDAGSVYTYFHPQNNHEP